MRLVQEDRQIVRSEDMKEMSFGISLNDTSHILGILRDRLYTNKILAVIREYATNALDANVDNGKAHVPIEIKVPTAYNTTFAVRDFGKGLSEDDVRTIYTQYGASTKRNSNSSIGQLGIGCKSGFAYTDSFTIISYHGGLKTVYTAYLDEDGTGKIARLSSEPSSENTGLEVSMSVIGRDLREFQDTIRSVVQYFSPTPEFIGAKLTIDQPKSLFNGSKWRLIDDATRYKCNAVMGSIAYPVNLDIFNSLTPDEKKMLHSCDLFFNIGDLEIAANREGLEYKEKTRQILEKKFRFVFKEFAEKFQDELDNASTYIEACQKLVKICYTYKFISRQKYTWHGSPIYRTLFNVNFVSAHSGSSPHGKIIDVRDYGMQNTIYEFPDDASFNEAYANMFMAYTHSRKTPVKISSLDVESATSTTIVWHDECKNVKSRIDNFKKSFPGSRLLIIRANGKLRENLLERSGLKHVEIINLSDLPEAPRVSGGGAKKNGTTNKKHSMSAFHLKNTELKNGSIASDYYETCEVDLSTGGVYIVIDRFVAIMARNNASSTPNVLDTVSCGPDKLQKVLANLYYMGVPKIDVLHAFKPPMLTKLDKSKWMSLEQYINMHVDKIRKTVHGFFAKHEVALYQNRAKNWDNLHGSPVIDAYKKRWKEICKMAEGLPKDPPYFLTQVAETTIMGRYWATNNTAELLDDICNHERWRKLYDEDMRKMEARIMDRYPLLKITDYRNLSPESLKEIQDYITFKEKAYEAAVSDHA